MKKWWRHWLRQDLDLYVGKEYRLDFKNMSLPVRVEGFTIDDRHVRLDLVVIREYDD